MLCGGAISWASQMQKVVATSSAEAEYMAVSAAAHECLFLRKICSAMFGQELKQMPPTTIWEDNEGCRKWCENPLNHAKMKHIDVAYHFVREQQTEFRTLVVKWIDGTDNPADIGTKPLPAPAFEKFLRQMMQLGDRSLKKTCPTSTTDECAAKMQQSDTAEGKTDTSISQTHVADASKATAEIIC